MDITSWHRPALGCYNSGTITAGTAVGLFYHHDGTIKNSCNFGEINGTSYAVGLVAKAKRGGGNDGADITCCLNKGNVISTAGIAYGVADDSRNYFNLALGSYRYWKSTREGGSIWNS